MSKIINIEKSKNREDISRECRSSDEAMAKAAALINESLDDINSGVPSCDGDEFFKRMRAKYSK